MDAKTLEMFEMATTSSAARNTEMAQHNLMVEANNAAVLALAARKEQAANIKGRVALVAQFKEL